MAYVAPTIRSVGDAVTAAAWNVLTNDILQFAPFVQGVFTDEAARDAAITAPTEGMHAYLTAPTVPAATNTTILPSGIQTIYNGSVWVCVTEVGSVSTAAGTTSSTSYGDISFGGAVISVTLVTGTTAMVHLTGDIEPWGGLVNGVSVKTGSVAATDIFYTETGNAGPSGRFSTSVIFPSLTAGTNTFTVQGKTEPGGTIKVTRPSLVVKGIA